MLLSLKLGWSPLAEATFRVTLRRTIQAGSLSSWIAGGKAAGRDLRWIERKAKVPVPRVELWPSSVADMAERADVAAGRYTRSVRELARKLEDEGVQDPMRAAVERNQYRLDRIAASDNAAYFNRGRNQTVVESTRRARLEELGRTKLVQVWDSLLDACPECFALDGVQADRDGTFPGGLTPGAAHPWCRCSYHYDLESIAWPLAA